MTERYASFERGGARWLLQRLTAVFLVGVLAFHFALLHFVNHAADVTFAGTRVRMRRPAYFLTMVLFLVTGTVHGLNGAYNALVNHGLSGRPLRAAKWVLIAAGALLIVQGLRVAAAMTGLAGV